MDEVVGGLMDWKMMLTHITDSVDVAGVTPCPNDRWMTRVARNVTMADARFLAGSLCLIHDRDGKYRAAFDETITAAGVKPIKLPARSPNLNAYAQRWVRSVTDGCPSKLIIFGEASPRREESPGERHRAALCGRRDRGRRWIDSL